MSRITYLAIFLAGLALAVHSMLHGVERWRRRRTGKPSPVLNPPTVAAMLLGFGACGYLIASRSSLGTLATLAISAATSAASFTGMTFLMAKWALRTTSHSLAEQDDISGQVAVVSQAITPHQSGEVSYYAWDAQHVLPARSIDGSSIPEGAEVVIDTLENGIARVELWSIVEQRL